MNTLVMMIKVMLAHVEADICLDEAKDQVLEYDVYVGNTVEHHIVKTA